MASAYQASFRKRFARRVLLPGALIVALTAALCGFGLAFAGRGVDDLSLEGQNYEAMRAIMHGLDDVALAQEVIGLCETCVGAAASPRPDEARLTRSVAVRLFDLARIHETYVLNGQDEPVYAAVSRRQVPLSAFDPIAPSVERLVGLARGEVRRRSGESNWSERLPDSPIPQYSSARTSADAVHATDLVRIGNRVALASVMRMVDGDARAVGAEHAPLLVSLRWFDEAFAADVARQNFLPEPRFSDAPAPRQDEAGIVVTNSDGVPMTKMFWKPLRPASLLIRSMLPWVLGGFGSVVLLVLLMSLKLRRLMQQDVERVAELERAHVELKAREAQAHHLAYHDVLTGLPNRALFNDKAEQALIRARHGERAAILLLDLDRFKNVNDRFGHLAGDALIQEVARRLTGVIGRPEAVARLGGDEFAILLLPEDLDEGIEVILDRILAELRRPFEILGNQAHVGVSIGVALAPDCGTERTDLMRKADIALYRAKEEGRDCYRFFTDAMDETVQLRAFLEADLRVALASGEGLCVHYQPLVDSAGRKVIGLEALLRWHHPTRGWIAPHLFVPVAEETGLISAIGDWVLGEACKVAREWPDLTVAVNLSPVQFCDDGFADRICRLVRDAGVSPRQIELEVTEGVVLDQNESVRGPLKRLRREGFRIALDDFGTGYSSLSYLRDFEVDKIKIDKSFIQKIGHRLDAGSIVTAVVSLGHAMGLEVTAEGVETADQEDFLRSAGCSQLQGFRFSRAVPPEKLRRSLDHWRRAA